MAKANATTTTRAKAGTATVKRSKTKTLQAFVKKGKNFIPNPKIYGSACPHCGLPISNGPAISRIDNKTAVCPDCGTLESWMIERGSTANHDFAYDFFRILRQFNEYKKKVSQAVSRFIQQS